MSSTQEEIATKIEIKDEVEEEKQQQNEEEEIENVGEEEEEEEEEEKLDPKDADFNPTESGKSDDETFTAPDDSDYGTSTPHGINYSGPFLAVEKENNEIFFLIETENGEKRISFSKARAEYPQQLITFFENNVKILP